MRNDKESKAEQQKQVQLPTDARCERGEAERRAFVLVECSVLDRLQSGRVAYVLVSFWYDC